MITESESLSTVEKVEAHYGGVWQKVSPGRTLVSEGVIEANSDDWCGTVTAGEFTAYIGFTGGQVKHTLSISEMPSHNHTVDGSYNAGSPIIGMAGGKGTKWGNTANTTFTGNGEAHNNMMPYRVVYMYKRIS